MPRPTAQLHVAFASRLKGLERTRRRVEQLRAEGRLARRDLDLVYASLFLTATTAFEGLIEDLFIGLLAGGLTRRGCTRIVTTSSAKVAHQLVTQSRRYVNWLPYQETVERARLFFSQGLPFTSLDSNEMASIEKMRIIRNAIAHDSRYALRQFERAILAAVPLRPAERSPAGFLRSSYSSNPPVTRYEILIGDLNSVTVKLAGA